MWDSKHSPHAGFYVLCQRGISCLLSHTLCRAFWVNGTPGVMTFTFPAAQFPSIGADIRSISRMRSSLLVRGSLRGLTVVLIGAGGGWAYGHKGRDPTHFCSSLRLLEDLSFQDARKPCL
jgi:hypothetical protein